MFKKMAALCDIVTILVQVFLHVLIFRISLYMLKMAWPRDTIGAFHKRYVLITGCDSGFGKEIAIHMDKLGFNVFAACLTTEGQNFLTVTCSERMKTFHLDVTISESIQDAFNFVKHNIPPESGLWGLVNNAGVMTVGPVEWTPLDIYKHTADVNLWGVIEMTKTFLPMIKQAKGRVINVSSFLGQMCLQNMSPYCITKYGIEAFSDALRREIKPWGVRVVVVEPGVFKTKMADPDMYRNQISSLWNDLNENLKNDYGKDSALDLITRFQCAVTHQADPDVHRVVDAVVDSLTSNGIPNRYCIGLDASILVPCANLLPTGIVDTILARHYHQFSVLSKKPCVQIQSNRVHTEKPSVQTQGNRVHTSG